MYFDLRSVLEWAAVLIVVGAVVGLLLEALLNELLQKAWARLWRRPPSPRERRFPWSDRSGT